MQSANRAGPRIGNVSGHLGVSRFGTKWRARVQRHGITHNLGIFDDAEAAAEAASAKRAELDAAWAA
ncbi:hypothetical protein [Microbacterium lacus]|uniref:hypothetical protein n=1 Tax=Microbacterium lacus TaxID=415217 RepID=UPI001E3938A8|nr:hypothetical protein [Microbacterium lacus]